MNRVQRPNDTPVKRAALFGERGFSLVEVIASIVISLMVIGAAFTALISAERATRATDLVVQTQQNARVAMELLARDVKMAGFGFTGGTVGACTVGGTPVPVVPADNNTGGADTGPDQVSLVVPQTNTTVAPVWDLRTQATGPFNQVDLRVGSVAAMVTAGLAVNDVVSIGGAVSAGVTVIDVGNDRLTLDTSVGPPRVFPTGTLVFLLQCINYNIAGGGACTGPAPCLWRAGVPVVDGIEDLQLSYACDGCNAVVNGGVPDGIPDDQNASNSFDSGDFITDNTWALPPMSPDRIRLVQINIVARQPDVDQGVVETDNRGAQTQNTLGPIIISDHDPSADAGFDLPTYQASRRRVLSRTVQTRNMGQ